MWRSVFIPESLILSVRNWKKNGYYISKFQFGNCIFIAEIFSERKIHCSKNNQNNFHVSEKHICKVQFFIILQPFWFKFHKSVNNLFFVLEDGKKWRIFLTYFLFLLLSFIQRLLVYSFPTFDQKSEFKFTCETLWEFKKICSYSLNWLLFLYTLRWICELAKRSSLYISLGKKWQKIPSVVLTVSLNIIV